MRTVTCSLFLLSCVSAFKIFALRRSSPARMHAAHQADDQSIEAIISQSRQRSHANGRKGCCYKASDYLSSTQAASWPLPAVEESVLRPYRRQISELKFAPSSRFTMDRPASVSAYKGVETRSSAAKKYCKYDAIRSSLKQARDRQRSSTQSSGDYLESTMRVPKDGR